MEKEIKITLNQRDKENVLRLIYAIDRQIAWQPSMVKKLSRELAYDNEQFGKDVKSLLVLADELQRAFSEDGDNDE